MHIYHNFSLLKFNTFHVPASCKFFTKIYSIDDIQSLFKVREFNHRKYLILGEGSNILFVNNFSGFVLKNEIKGIMHIKETKNSVYLKVGSGENWHSFVNYCLDNNLYGVENLSLIPGTIGAAPVQNIGAYGVEVKEVIENVEGIDLKSKKTIVLSNKECNFSYRNSIFKKKGYANFFITYVIFRLRKRFILNIDYPSIKEEIDKMKISKSAIQPRTISNIIIKIRQNKLPDPKKVGNAGSFFHNPIVSQKFLRKMLLQYPQMPYFFYKQNLWKISSAWLIRGVGIEPKKHQGIHGVYGIYPKHFLVLVNYGKATGKEILQFSEKIQKLVQKKYKIYLKREISVI